MSGLIYFSIPYSFFIMIGIIGGIYWRYLNTIDFNSFSFFVAYSFFVTLIIYLCNYEKKTIYISAILCSIFWGIGGLRQTQQHTHFMTIYNALHNKKIDAFIKIIRVEKTGKSFPAYAYKTYASMQYIYIRSDKAWFPLHTTVLVFSRTSFGNINDMVLLEKLIFPSIKNESMQHYLKKENACATFFINDTGRHISIMQHAQPSVYCWIQTIKEKIYTIAQEKLSLHSHILFSTLFLGKKDKSDEYHTLSKLFRNWGIVHLLARSGIHLLLYICVWQFIFSFFGCPPWIKYLFLLIITAVLYVFTFFSISFARAYYMFILYTLFRMCLLPCDNLHIFSLITSTFLLYNPTYLFCLDFQLSFCLTGILIFAQKINLTHQK